VKELSFSLGRIIAARRQKAGLSQEDLAAKAGIHRTYVSQLERGLKSPTINVLARVAAALDTRPSQLLRLLEKEFDELSAS
jgi:transcriptional regulator with XRE-family HTH domain